MLKWLGLAGDDTTTTGTGGVVGAPRIPAGSLRAPVRSTASSPMKSMNALRPSVSPLGNRRVMSSSDIGEETKPDTASATLTGGARNHSRKNRKTKYRMPGRRTTRKAERKNRKASRKSRRASRKNRK